MGEELTNEELDLAILTHLRDASPEAVMASRLAESVDQTVERVRERVVVMGDERPPRVLESTVASDRWMLNTR